MQQVTKENNNISKINKQKMLNEFNIKINNKQKEFNNLPESAHGLAFNQWLGGIMDSDGCFYIRNEKYVSCEIALHVREIDGLNKIKLKFGGSVKPVFGANHVRWRLYKKELVKTFLIALNSNIYYKIDKYKQAMKLYAPEVPVIKKSFKLSGAWFSGFFEGDGCVYLCDNDYLVSIVISQKNRDILTQIKSVYGGNINYSKTWDSYVWRTANSKDLVKLFEYFTLYPLKSKKNEDVISGKQFFKYRLLGYHLNTSARHDQLDLFIKRFRERRSNLNF